MITKERERRFWERLGWQFLTEYKYGRPCNYWLSPDRNYFSGEPRGKNYYPPPIDLNNLFRWGVPLLDSYMMFTGEGGIHFIASKDGLNYEAIAEKEEEALFEALEEALEVQDD